MSGKRADQRAWVTVSSLVPGYSPRLCGEVEEHVELLAELDEPLPPLLVQRSTMRVIDGMHRLRAAVLRGDPTIEVEFFDGDEAAAFVAAVRANVTHGPPLPRAHPDPATARIVASHPHFSDRAIAAITGVAARTVAAVRHRTAPDAPPTVTRIGRDGRVRPLNSTDARLVASRMIRSNPHSSLRDIARRVGLSPATVRDVRERMRRGEDPVPQRKRRTAFTDDRDRPVRPSDQPLIRDREALLRNLNRDPSLRFSESGRAVLRWLFAHACGPDGWQQMIADIPPHCAYVVAELAYGCAAEWRNLADHLEQRISETA
jgi:hypothetical protein